MSSDRERISSDPNQQYRSVVFQQGRVTLASDSNEAWDIADEALRADVDDIVGPIGTPDNGYAVSYPGKLGQVDFTIGKGTLYLGGERLELAQDITYLEQKDGEWLDLSEVVEEADTEQVWLLVREQELGATEDPNLLEVALGGPDTTQRTRLIQRVHRSKVQSSDCSVAWGEVLAQQKTDGYDFDSQRMRFLPFARLQVGFADAQPQPDPCEPAAVGGYLGADNQCIRVMVTAYDAGGGSAKIAWAFDNAYNMFEVVVQPDMQTLQLSAPPVDTSHWPRTGQAVEVLRSAVRLADGATMAQNLGQFGLLAADYNADQRTVQLATALTDPPFKAKAVDPPVFLRLWQEQLDAKVGQAVTLRDTGLQVTLTADGNNSIAPGVFWIFAVRPTTPQAVYPQRYLAQPQPPEGPRLWGGPLAILQWAREFATVTNCLDPFDNLVELTKRKCSCCEYSIGTQGTYPDLASAFADLVEKHVGTVGLCLLPDPPVHKLNRPIQLLGNPQLRVELTGSGPMTTVEIAGGGFQVQDIGAFALDKLHLRLMDEQSRLMVTNCDSVEVLRTRIDRVVALQTAPMLDVSSNHSVRIDDSTFDAGHAMLIEFVSLLRVASPLAAALFAPEVPSESIQATVDRLTPIAALSPADLNQLLKATTETITQLGFDKSPYQAAMARWIGVIGEAQGAAGNQLTTLAENLKEVLQALFNVQSTQPGTGVVLDLVANTWLESSEFRCSVSFTGLPGAGIDFAQVARVFKGKNVTANGQVTYLTRSTFDLLTYGETFANFVANPGAANETFNAPSALTVDGCIFRGAPCFFVGADVFLTGNSFASPINIAALVLSDRFCPLANTGAEGPIRYLASNALEAFIPVNLIALQAL
jgi:hypothetical protein